MNYGIIIFDKSVRIYNGERIVFLIKGFVNIGYLIYIKNKIKDIFFDK